VLAATGSVLFGDLPAPALPTAPFAGVLAAARAAGWDRPDGLELEDLAAGRLPRDIDFAAAADFAFLRAEGVFFCPVSLAMQPLKNPPASMTWGR
jgi:hypothetical protein